MQSSNRAMNLNSNSNHYHSNDNRDNGKYSYELGEKSNSNDYFDDKSNEFLRSVFPTTSESLNDDKNGTPNQIEFKERNITWDTDNQKDQSLELFSEYEEPSVISQIISNFQQQLAQQKVQQFQALQQQLAQQLLQQQITQQLMQQQILKNRINENLAYLIQFFSNAYTLLGNDERSKMEFKLLGSLIELRSHLDQLPVELKEVLDVQLLLRNTLRDNPSEEKLVQIELCNANLLNLLKSRDQSSAIIQYLLQLSEYLSVEIEFILNRQCKYPVKTELFQTQREKKKESKTNKLRRNGKQEASKNFKKEQRLHQLEREENFQSRITNMNIKEKKINQIAEILKQLNIYINEAKRDSLLFEEITPLQKILSNVEEKLELIPERLRPLLIAQLDLLCLILQGKEFEQKSNLVLDLLREADLRSNRPYEELLLDLNEAQMRLYLFKMESNRSRKLKQELGVEQGVPAIIIKYDESLVVRESTPYLGESEVQEMSKSRNNNQSRLNVPKDVKFMEVASLNLKRTLDRGDSGESVQDSNKKGKLS